MIKNIIFGVDEILIDVKNTAVYDVLPAELKTKANNKYKKIMLKDFWKECVESAKNCVISEVVKRKVKVKTESLLEDFYNGKFAGSEFLDLLTKDENFGKPRDVVEAVYNKLKLKTNNKLIGSTINNIKRLKEQGFGIYVLANVGTDFEDTFHYMLDDNLFNGVMFSSEVKSALPNENVYQKAIKSWKIKPEESLFVDNDEQNLKTFTRLMGYTLNFDGKNAIEENKRVADYVYKINLVTK